MTQVLMVSDHDASAQAVRQALIGGGIDCPADHILSPEGAISRLVKTQPDLVVAVLGPHRERVLDAIPKLGVKPPSRMIVVGPATDPKMVLRVLRGGADEYVDESDLDTELAAALSRCLSASGLDQSGKLIAILSPSGGCGSSTVAVNIATSLAQQHKEVALLDMKLESGDLAALLDLKPGHTLADLCQNVTRLDRALFDRVLTRHENGVHLLAAPRQLVDVPSVTADGISQAVALARATYPYVIVDLEHAFRDEQMAVLKAADVILVVLRLEFAALRNTHKALEHLERSGVAKDRFRLVVNRYGQPKEVPAAKAEEALGRKIDCYLPDDPKTVIRANNNGVPVVVEAPAAKVSKGLMKLASDVNGRHK